MGVTMTIDEMGIPITYQQRGQAEDGMPRVVTYFDSLQHAIYRHFTIYYKESFIYVKTCKKMKLS